MIAEDKLSTDEEKIADAFNKYFATVSRSKTYYKYTTNIPQSITNIPQKYYKVAQKCDIVPQK